MRHLHRSVGKGGTHIFVDATSTVLSRLVNEHIHNYWVLSRSHALKYLPRFTLILGTPCESHFTDAEIMLIKKLVKIPPLQLSLMPTCSNSISLACIPLAANGIFNILLRVVWVHVYLREVLKPRTELASFRHPQHLTRCLNYCPLKWKPTRSNEGKQPSEMCSYRVRSVSA